MFTLDWYGRVVAVLFPGESKELACLYSAHNLPILNIGSSPLPSFGWDYCDIFDIQKYLLTLTVAAKKKATHKNVNILVIFCLNLTILDIFKNLITLAVKKCPRSLNLINNWPRNWKNKFMKVFKKR